LLSFSYETENLYTLVDKALLRANGALKNKLPRQAFKFLLRGLRSRSDDLRENCAQAIGMIADLSLVTALKGRLKDKNR
jgi:HEAT repeat protein